MHPTNRLKVRKESCVRETAKCQAISAGVRMAAPIIAGILLLIAASSHSLFGQTLADSVKWRIYLLGIDSGDMSMKPITLIGLHPDAHNPIPPTDTMKDFGDRWSEYLATRLESDSEWSQIPPAPPGSYWQISNLRQPYGTQYKVMYHKFTDTTMSDTTVVKWGSTTINNFDTLNQTWIWPSPKVLKHYADSILLTDITGHYLRINLTKDSLYNYNILKDTIPGTGGAPISTNNLRLIIFHPKRAPLPPDIVGLVYPVNGATNLFNVDTLQWAPTPTFDGLTVSYRCQIATDRTFEPGSIVLQDSIVKTTRRFILPHTGWYYWRVKAFAQFGVGIYKSTPDSFMVSALLPKDTIVASAGPHGSISPPGITLLTFGDTQKYSIVPAPGYHVDTLIVDGSVVPPDTTYTFSDVRGNHSISVSFAINHYTITLTAGSNGMVIPNGIVDLVYGDSLVCIARPNVPYEVDSLVVDGVYQGHDTEYVFRNIASNHTFRARFAYGSSLLSWSAADKWNLMSVPLSLLDYRTTTIFPAATAGAYYFYTSYLHTDTLSNGTGYWLRFTGDQVIKLRGNLINIDTIPVNAGWNMIGSISLPVAVSDILCSPPGMTTSPVFGYSSGYFVTTIVSPGYGYWIKADQPGNLILTAAPANGASHIRIVSTSELPPPPPDGSMANEKIGIPKRFALEQNYPNPFNPSTTITYALPERSFVVLTVYNLLGAEVRVLQNGYQDAGYKTVTFEGKDLPSGIYFYRLQAGKFTAAGKAMLLK